MSRAYVFMQVLYVPSPLVYTMHNCTTAQLPYPRYPRLKCSSQTAPHALIHPWIHGIDSIPSTIHISLKSAMPWAPKADPSALPIRPSALYLRTPLLPLHHSQLLSAHCQPTAASIRPPRYMSLSTRQWPPFHIFPQSPSCLSVRLVSDGVGYTQPSLSAVRLALVV